MMRHPLLLTIVLGAWLGGAASPLLGQSDLVFEHATVITGDGGLLEDATVVVSGGTITAVLENDAGAGQAVSNAGERIDLSGRYLMPAMLDAHAHLGYQSPSGWGAEYYSRDNLISNLRQYAYYGFSAAFSAGTDPDELALALQQEQAENQGDAARFLFAAGMGPPGQGPNDAFLVETSAVSERTGQTILRGIDSPAQAIYRAREVADLGIPFIKIWVDDRGGSQTKLSQDVYLPLVAEARRQRLEVVVHQQTAADMPALVHAGVSGFLHGRLGPELGPDIAAVLAEEDVFLVPNLGLGELRGETIGRDDFLAPVLSPAEQSRLAVAGEQRRVAPALNPEREAALRESLAHLLSAGVDIVLGTDAGALPDHPFGYSGHRELEIYVRLGMTPMEALVAATGNAARHLGQTDLGIIETGRRADFIVLGANPLTDIRHTRQIDAVYLNGRRIDRQAISQALRSQP